MSVQSWDLDNFLKASIELPSDNVEAEIKNIVDSRDNDDTDRNLLVSIESSIKTENFIQAEIAVTTSFVRPC
jgi:hypothetical protein